MNNGRIERVEMIHAARNLTGNVDAILPTVDVLIRRRMQQLVEITVGHEFEQESVVPRRFANTYQLNDVGMILNLEKNSSFLSQALDFPMTTETEVWYAD